MNCKYLFVAMILFASCSTMGKKNQLNDTIISDTISSKKDSQSDRESEYLNSRKNYVEHLRGLQKVGKNIDSLSKEDSKALKDLENKLRVVLKESNFSNQGKINLKTLLEQPLDNDMLDGLIFEKDSMRIFYTSKNVFLDYFKESKDNHLDELTPKHLEDIFQRTFIPYEPLIRKCICVKVKSTSNIQAYGMVSTTCMMDCPQPPNGLFVFVSSGNYIYMCEENLKKPILEIHSCRMVYDSILQEADKQRKIYDSSNGKDTTALNSSQKLELEVWVKYGDCYQKELKNDSQYEDIKRQIEDLVKFLEQEKN